MGAVKSARYLHFSEFCLDLGEEQLRRGTQPIALRRKPLAILRYLLEHPGQVVTRNVLLAAIWPEIHVNEEVLTVHLREVRKVLGDDARTPRFIETMHGRGYRFIAPVTAAPVPSAEFRVPTSSPSPIPTPQHPTPILVGRETELVQLNRSLDQALSGERQIVFVTGEPGIGKTSLLEAFLTRFADGSEHAHELWIGRGQCIEQYGAKSVHTGLVQCHTS